jgi:hypothetical protein
VTTRESIKAVLQPHPNNPRYFRDGSGKALYLAGSHTWNNLVDIGTTDPPTGCDFSEYLDFLDRENHNFFRLWTWHHPNTWSAGHYVRPLPWPRSGGGKALDGKPRFNLLDFDNDYFSRLYDRVDHARRRGFYVAVMLFECNMIFEEVYRDTWRYSPFVTGNNSNGLELQMSGRNGQLREWVRLENKKVLEIQERYVRRVMDTVANFDNVLYEVANEAGPLSHEWQEYWLDYIRTYEVDRDKKHPIGVTGGWGTSNRRLFSSNADWIAPDNRDDQPEERYRRGLYTWGDAPHDSADKVVVLDTDHLWGLGGDASWAWKSFCRGYNLLYMDRCDDFPWAWYESKRFRTLHDDNLRREMGQILAVSQQMDLAKMFPRNDIASTGYCLANEGKEYIVYQPKSNAFTVKLKPGTYIIRWHDPTSGKTARPYSQRVRKEQFFFDPPFKRDSVLSLCRIS